MVKKHVSAVFIFFILFILYCSGCMDVLFENSTKYQSHATTIRYDFSYGYEINSSGIGTYSLRYFCDKPDVLLGSISSLSLLYPLNYEEITAHNNQIILWNISETSPESYKLGVKATIFAHTFFVPDLNGKNALSLQEIALQYPDLIRQYCGKQILDNMAYIDPSYEDVINTTTSIHTNTQSDNAFVLAQALFSWLKENTNYKIHESETGVQLVSTTYQLKTGDCDDLSFLYISLCRSLEIPARFIRGYLFELKNEIPTADPHAWVEVFVGDGIGNNGWIPVECAGSGLIQTEIHQNFGVEDAMHLRLFVDDGSNESLNLSLSSISWSYSPPVDVNVQSFLTVENYIVVESKQLTVTKDGLRSFQ